MSKNWHSYIPPLGLAILLAAGHGCSSNEDTPTQPPPTPNISVADAVVAEGSAAVINISLDRTAASRVIFQYTSSDISATSGSDYTPVSATDTINAGASSAAVLVLTIDDLDVEGAEQFSIALSSVTGATVARSLGTCTINDNDNATISFITQVQPLLLTSCALPNTCHGGAFPGGGMFLGVGAPYDSVMSATGNITGGTVVVAGNSAGSTLYTKTTASPPFQSRMPIGASPLSPQEQNILKNWIDQGAADN